MPPKFKFSKEEIIAAAFNLVRKNGWQRLTTRTLGEDLGSSAKPIYSFFKSMDDLDEELVKLSIDLLFEKMTRKRTGDPWIDHGIGYVLFAQEESHLFRGCNNEKNIKYFKAYGQLIWDKCSHSLMDYEPFQGLTEEQIYQVQATRWLMTHGLAFQVSNPPPVVWDNDNIMLMVQRGSIAILDGLKKQFASEGT